MMVNLVSTNKKQQKGDGGPEDVEDLDGGAGGGGDDFSQAGVDEGDDTNAEGASKLKKRKKVRKGKTIETNLNNIRVTHFETNFEKDPLFQILSESFDSGTGGLLLNHLHSVDDSNSLRLDSNAVRDRQREAEYAARCADARCVVREDLFDVAQLANRFICPSLKTFRFGGNGSEEDGDESVLSQIMSQKASKNSQDEDIVKHAFDMDAEPEPVEDDVAPMDDVAAYDDDDGGGGGMDDDDIGEPMDIRAGERERERERRRERG